MSTHESNTDIESKTRILTQEEIDEQCRNYIALEEAGRRTDSAGSRNSNSHRPNLSQRAGTSASSAAAGPSLDNLA